MILPYYNCVCCQHGTVENIVPLFVTCPFATACWGAMSLQVWFAEPFSVREDFCLQLQVPFFMDILITMSWSIWMQRNDLIFRGIAPTVQQCMRHFKKAFAQVILHAKSRHKIPLSTWLEALL